MRLVLLHALPFDARMWGLAGLEVSGAVVPTLYGLGRSIEEWAAAIIEMCDGEDLATLQDKGVEV